MAVNKKDDRSGKKSADTGRTLIIVLLGFYMFYKLDFSLPTFEARVFALFVVLFVAWNLFMQNVLIGRIAEDISGENDRGTYLWLYSSYLLVIIYSALDFIYLGWTRMNLLEPYVVYAGFFFFICHMLIKTWAFRHLDRFFNPRVVVYDEHRLIETGPYRFIRHPLYLASIILFLAIPMILSSWGGLIIALLLAAPGFASRIRAEEELLAIRFGDEFREYQRKTGRILPRWRRQH